MAIYTTNNKIWKLDNKWVNKPEVVPPGPTFDEVTIGTQTWMAKNLAIDDDGEGIYVVDNVTANGVNFGTQYYYTWDAAVRVANTVEGWHLPSKAEWGTLFSVAGGTTQAGTKLKSTTGWNNNGSGTDNYGFTILPTGSYSSGTLSDVGGLAYLWTSNENGSSYAYYYYILKGNSNVYDNYMYKTKCYSVRLIKDS